VGDQLRQQISRIPDELAADPTPVTQALARSGRCWSPSGP
jgi:hypothetical protein